LNEDDDDESDSSENEEDDDHDDDDDDDDEIEDDTEETTENEMENSTKPTPTTTNNNTTTEDSSEEMTKSSKKPKLSNTTSSTSPKTKSKKNSKKQKQQQQQCSSRANTFFKRSDSTLCLGGQAPDPFAHTIDEALPLAVKPHLLNPHSRLQDMFRVRINHVKQFKSLNRVGLVFANVRDHAPTIDPNEDTVKTEKTNHYACKLEKQIIKLANSNSNDDKSSNSILTKPDELIDRWRLTVDLFGRVFCDDVGLEPASVIRQCGGFQLKEAKFRREMERLRNVATRDLSMEVDRNRDLLLQMTFKSLNNMYNLQLNRRVAAAAAAAASSSSTTSSSTTATISTSSLPPPLCLSRIKVTFRDEQGEGSGVARSFYTAFAEAILADSNLPPLDSASLSSATNQHHTQHSNHHHSHHSHHSNSHSSSSPSSSSIYSSFSMQRYRNVRSSIAASEHSRRSAASAINNALNTTNAIRSSIRARDPQQLLSINSYLSSSHNLHNVSVSIFYLIRVKIIFKCFLNEMEALKPCFFLLKIQIDPVFG
jgi:hypothetical protein